MPKSTPEPRVAVFFGLTASGKSYLGSSWAREHGYPYFNTDAIRKELAGVRPTCRAGDAYNEGLYGSEQTERTYAELLRRARRALDSGAAAGVVLDGSFLEEKRRAQVTAALARDCELFFVYCWCSEACTRERLAARARDPQAVSDADLDVYLRQRDRFTGVDRVAGARLLRLNTEADRERLLGAVDTFVEAAAAESRR